MTFADTPDRLSGMPLATLPAVVLDTETTGLDVSRDRVIEIGAVRLSHGPVETAETFATLIDPGTPLAPASSRVHGIRDADVTGAPGFADGMAAFVQWAGPSLIVGYSVGFDLAILKAEHGRCGLAWRAPRSLDIAHLVAQVAPRLPDLSLETAAAWLEIEIGTRHRAVADARLAARLFLALVPKLRAQGVRTLAEAERACRSLTGRMDEEARIGWHRVGRAGPAATRLAEYARIESFPYRHRVSALMTVPPLIIDNDMAIKDALDTMLANKVSSLFLEEEPGIAGYGIITERDVLRALSGMGAEALGAPVRRFARRPLFSVETEEFAYRALVDMAKGGFRHLGVFDEAGALVGALSARDLLRQRAQDAVALGDSIEAAATPAALGTVWSELTAVVRALVFEEVDVRDIAAIISRELRALTRRACELAAAELEDGGRGGAPVPYAMLVLGSGGRGESLLAMDQDNAIVYRSGADVDAVDPWFEALGTRVADILNDAGLAYCKGGVMAANAAWRSDLTDGAKPCAAGCPARRPGTY